MIKTFIKEITPPVEEWNKLSSAPYDKKNEKDMFIEEQMEEIDAVCDQLFVLIGTKYKQKEKPTKEQQDKIYAVGFDLMECVGKVYNMLKGEKCLIQARKHFDEVIRANNDKLIPTRQGVHTEQKGNNKFKIGKPEGWNPPEHRKIFYEYFNR